ncbi:MAG: nucleoside-diphosphate sugar epimerase/dehydratase [Phenylobacterium sp.]|uniref:polysaccharide biosynthesis protein n=1 Tax=Phenylobacterium sp. TaxID=1871053 RepID=UPI002718C3AB|nr:nucleoside-diphosphate sugar epimerase/dehydratase [Phenylobacterium sp.]MDO8408548.1 nucleoside-diphosphate sugar epimerase/dehydratase [Phenylobacterium sp.]
MMRMAFRAQTVVVDVAIAALAFLCAYLLSPSALPDLGFDGRPSLNIIQLTAIYAAFAAVFTTLFRGELSPWRYASIPDALVIGRIAALTAVLFLLTVWVLDRASTLPRSALAMAAVFHVTGCLGLRVLRRAIHERALVKVAPIRSKTGAQAPALLLIGPPALADTYLRDAARAHDRRFTPVGIIGLDLRDVGQQVRGVCILESLDRLDEALVDLRRWNRYPRAVLFLDEPSKIKGLSPDHLGRFKAEGVRMLRLPSIVDLRHHEGVALMPLRDVSVEELLAREPIELDAAPLAALIRGRRVLITGAGGSIGGELARQVASFDCAHLTLVDSSESALFAIEREVAESYPDISRTAVLCDVRHAGRLQGHFAAQAPDLVFHAAALKHVSMVERLPCEGVLTNVIGTWNVAEAARLCGAAQMVLISTDKAVDPTNVMGATKRLAEAVIQAQQTHGGKTRFAAVRFGNVLGSAGSVVPIFKSQIERGGPVTLTHPDMTRFFMTIPEAVQLVLHATAASAEDRDAQARLFILDMGQPVRIMDLARQMIALSGRTLGQDIEIEVTGLRPGEKLTETLLDEDEQAAPCAPKVMQVVSNSAVGITPGHLQTLEALAEQADAEGVRTALFDLVGQVRGQRPGGAPRLKVVAGG